MNVYMNVIIATLFSCTARCIRFTVVIDLPLELEASDVVIAFSRTRIGLCSVLCCFVGEAAGDAAVANVFMTIAVSSFAIFSFISGDRAAPLAS